VVVFNIEKGSTCEVAQAFSCGYAEKDTQKGFRFSASTATAPNLEAEKDSVLFTIRKNTHKDEE